jgi:predicted transport protein
LEPQNQSAACPGRNIVDQRRQPRFKLEVKISINSRTSGLLKGYTVDISDSGISAIVRIEVPLDEVVELEFTLPLGPVRVYAMVRQRSAFRYGFQFVQSESAEEIIKATCRELAIEQSLLAGF